MLKYQITLILVLIGCIAFVACERAQEALMPVMPDPEPEMMVDYSSWEHVVLENAVGTGATAHAGGSRTVYFNEAAALANKAEGTKMYPVGSMIYKEVMNADNTMVTQLASMMKSDDPMYADHGGWVYGVGGDEVSTEVAAHCDSCHVKAGEGMNDYVFVSLMKADDGMNGDDTGMNGDDTGMNGDDTNGGNGNGA